MIGELLLRPAPILPQRADPAAQFFQKFLVAKARHIDEQCRAADYTYEYQSFEELSTVRVVKPAVSIGDLVYRKVSRLAVDDLVWANTSNQWSDVRSIFQNANGDDLDGIDFRRTFKALVARTKRPTGRPIYHGGGHGRVSIGKDRLDDSRLSRGRKRMAGTVGLVGMVGADAAANDRVGQR